MPPMISPFLLFGASAAGVVSTVFVGVVDPWAVYESPEAAVVFVSVAFAVVLSEPELEPSVELAADVLPSVEVVFDAPSVELEADVPSVVAEEASVEVVVPSVVAEVAPSVVAVVAEVPSVEVVVPSAAPEAASVEGVVPSVVPEAASVEGVVPSVVPEVASVEGVAASVVPEVASVVGVVASVEVVVPSALVVVAEPSVAATSLPLAVTSARIVELNYQAYGFVSFLPKSPGLVLFKFFNSILVPNFSVPTGRTDTFTSQRIWPFSMSASETPA